MFMHMYGSAGTIWQERRVMADPALVVEVKEEDDYVFVAALNPVNALKPLSIVGAAASPSQSPSDDYTSSDTDQYLLPEEIETAGPPSPAPMIPESMTPAHKQRVLDAVARGLPSLLDLIRRHLPRATPVPVAAAVREPPTFFASSTSVSARTSSAVSAPAHGPASLPLSTPSSALASSASSAQVNAAPASVIPENSAADEDARLVEIACSHLAHLVQTDSQQAAAGSAGAVELCVAVMRQRWKRAANSVQACAALRLLCRNVANRARAVDASAIEVLVGLLRHAEMHTESRPGCEASSHPESGSSTAEHGDVSSEQLPEVACGALKNLTATDDNKARAGAAGAVEVCVQVLRTARSEAALEQACGAVWSLCAHGGNRRRARALRAEAALTAASAAHPLSKSVQVYATGALKVLSLP